MGILPVLLSGRARSPPHKICIALKREPL